MIRNGFIGYCNFCDKFAIIYLLLQKIFYIFKKLLWKKLDLSVENKIKFIYLRLYTYTSLFMELAGIKYTKDTTGRTRYVRIDLERYGGNQLLEDFLDGLYVLAHKGEPSMPFEDFVREENKRRGIDV